MRCHMAIFSSNALAFADQPSTGVARRFAVEKNTQVEALFVANVLPHALLNSTTPGALLDFFATPQRIT